MCRHQIPEHTRAECRATDKQFEVLFIPFFSLDFSRCHIDHEILTHVTALYHQLTSSIDHKNDNCFPVRNGESIESFVKSEGFSATVD